MDEPPKMTSGQSGGQCFWERGLEMMEFWREERGGNGHQFVSQGFSGIGKWKQ